MVKESRQCSVKVLSVCGEPLSEAGTEKSFKVWSDLYTLSKDPRLFR